MRINKGLLAGTVAATLLTGGYYASAQGLPHITLGSPKVGPTTSYAPGTPAWLEYPGSPYQIGGPKGPQPGETWQQFQYHTPPAASPSTPSRVSANASKNAAVTSSSASTGNPPSAWHRSPTFTLAGTSIGHDGVTWHMLSYNGIRIPVPSDWNVLSDSASNLDFGMGSQGVSINVENGNSAYGVYWGFDATHALQFAQGLYPNANLSWVNGDAAAGGTIATMEQSVLVWSGPYHGYQVVWNGPQSLAQWAFSQVTDRDGGVVDPSGSL
ncbi:MAG: hypothetical protein C7B46_17535 [Sulfobacillus benefaciens]|uniref:Uncharacterized protein n=1 Tax=Sulfobacillus benefaciens TaxID=453960 RepID=A0A2T2X8R2_9FIRM|nr:MAG: hypothetical protein C7B46_17535 [Sulfobacillus benefaciens]